MYEICGSKRKANDDYFSHLSWINACKWINGSCSFKFQLYSLVNFFLILIDREIAASYPICDAEAESDICANDIRARRAITSWLWDSSSRRYHTINESFCIAAAGCLAVYMYRYRCCLTFSDASISVYRISSYRPPQYRFFSIYRHAPFLFLRVNFVFC